MKAEPMEVVAFIRARYLDGDVEVMAMTEEGGLLIRRLFKTVAEAKRRTEQLVRDSVYAQGRRIPPFKYRWVEFPTNDPTVQIAARLYAERKSA